MGRVDEVFQKLAIFNLKIMRNNIVLLLRKGGYICLVLLLALIPLITGAFSTAEEGDYEIARREVLLRKIGDIVLLQSGDSISRVLPVEKLSSNDFRIRFQNELTFEADSLVRTIRTILKDDALSQDYVVNVVKCGTGNIFYGFAISGDQKDDIIACKGRIQPKACYMIDIKFKQAQTLNTQRAYLLGGLPALAFVGFILLRSFTSRKHPGKTQNDVPIRLSSVLFDPGKKQLIINEERIELTGTENRLLLIFARSPNETIERSRLQKEIWEDEGIIVGRSLDMFISKLRKKLISDPKIRILVVRGKGYKLEID